MFERCSERVRRVIFFARYEAGQLGADKIGPQHLLIGLTREDRALFTAMAGGNDDAAGTVKKQMFDLLPNLEKISTSTDLPLNNQAKQVLADAQRESERLGHRHIVTGHLLLAMLKQEGEWATVLNVNGITWEAVNAQFVLQQPLYNWRSTIDELEVEAGRMSGEERDVLLLYLREALFRIRETGSQS